MREATLILVFIITVLAPETHVAQALSFGSNQTEDHFRWLSEKDDVSINWRGFLFVVDDGNGTKGNASGQIFHFYRSDVPGLESDGYLNLVVMNTRTQTVVPVRVTGRRRRNVKAGDAHGTFAKDDIVKVGDKLEWRNAGESIDGWSLSVLAPRVAAELHKAHYRYFTLLETPEGVGKDGGELWLLARNGKGRSAWPECTPQLPFFFSLVTRSQFTPIHFCSRCNRLVEGRGCWGAP